MRDAGVDSHFIAATIVQLLAGEDLDLVNAAITPHPRCIQCVLRIMGERGPFPTEEQRRLLDTAGWSRRRARREQRRRYQPSPESSPFSLW